MKIQRKLITVVCILGATHLLNAQFIGINTVNPVNQLTVNGAADFTDSVGIGTSNPSRKLDVNGEASFYGVPVGRGGGNNISNAIIGYGVLSSNTFGEEITSAGFLALSANTTGNENTAAGVYSLNSNTTGSGNTAIGSSSLSSNTTGSNNTAIGAYAGVASNNLMNATAIGANTIVNTSNSVIIGNNANVGIGISAPTSKLHVIGVTKISSLQMTTNLVNGYVLASDASGNGIWTDPNSLETDPQVGSNTTNMIPRWNGSSLVTGQLFDNGTNIGLGTTSPGVKFDVRATGNGVRVLSGGTGVGNHTSIQIGRIGTDGLIGVAAINDNFSIGDAAGDIVMRTESASQHLILNAGSVAATLVVTNSKTGMGTTAPVNTLDVEGALAVGSAYAGTAVAPANGMIIQGAVGIGTPTPVSTFHLASTTPKTSNSIVHLAYMHTSEAPASNPFALRMSMKGGDQLGDRYFAFQTTEYNGADGGDLILQRDGGKVGIGTSSYPVTHLEVDGGIRTKYSGSVVFTTNAGDAQDYNITVNPPLPDGWDFTNTVAYVHVADNQYGKILKTKVINSSTIQIKFKVTTTTALTRFNYVVFKL